MILFCKVNFKAAIAGEQQGLLNPRSAGSKELLNNFKILTADIPQVDSTDRVIHLYYTVASNPNQWTTPLVECTNDLQHC